MYTLIYTFNMIFKKIIYKLPRSKITFNMTLEFGLKFGLILLTTFKNLKMKFKIIKVV